MQSKLSIEIAKLIAKATKEQREKLVADIKRLDDRVTYSNQDFDRAGYLSSTLFEIGVEDKD